MVITNNQLRAIWNNDNSIALTNTKADINKNTWNFVVMSVTPTNVNLYVNDKKYTFNGSYAPVNFSSPVIIGYDTYSPGGFIGLIDNVRVYTSTLTSMEVKQLYAEGLKSHQDLAVK